MAAFSHEGGMARLRILCHNVFWFQGVPFSPDTPGEPEAEVLQALMDLYRQLEPDVLCLQEVQGEGVFHRLGASLGMAGAYCAGGQLGQYGGATLWRCGTALGDSQQAGPQRMWQMAAVSGEGGQGVTVCNVHLPSARQVGKTAAARQRVEELAGAVRTRPQVVVGDFNEAPGGGVSDFMTGQGYVNAAVLMDQAHSPTSLGGKRGDQIWVHESCRERVTGYGVLPEEDLATSIEGKTHLSDHLPLWVDLDREGEGYAV